MYIEPDITQRKVVDAWLVANQFPKSNGDRTGKRDKTAAGEPTELSIDFAGITMTGPNVERLAQNLLNSLTILNKIPDNDMVLPATALDANVSSADSVGFNRTM